MRIYSEELCCGDEDLGGVAGEKTGDLEGWKVCPINPLQMAKVKQ